MSDHPVTPAVRVLRAQNVPFQPHLYRYVDKGGTAASAQSLGLDEHAIVKTLIFEDETAQPLVVLMHGDRQVSAKAVARHLGRKLVKPCDPAVAQKHTGYLVGGTSPFGTRKALPVLMERSIGDLERVWINGGARGFLVQVATADLVRVLRPDLVDVAA